jgi:hypothetical protein
MRQIKPELIDEILNRGVNPDKVASNNPILINSFRKLVEINAKLAYKNKDHLIFYRGQIEDYPNRAGSSSFYPTIYRGDYLKVNELRNRFDILEGSCKALVNLFEDQKIEGYKELKRKKYIQWSVLQHYDVCKTPLLDFTHSLRVACSFALSNNNNEFGYVYSFGLPYLTNRISINSEHDLVNVRLLSICPPNALRPYFQEGYLAGTEDITTNYESKTELDFNNRLIIKYKIPNKNEFWGRGFNKIPQKSLYPDNDPIYEICKIVKEKAKRELKSGDLGEFLKEWSELEQLIQLNISSDRRRFLSLREGLSKLLQTEELPKDLYYQIERLRKFRNQLVHTPKKIEPSDVHEFLNLLINSKLELKQILQ